MGSILITHKFFFNKFRALTTSWLHSTIAKINRRWAEPASGDSLGSTGAGLPGPTSPNRSPWVLRSEPRLPQPVQSAERSSRRGPKNGSLDSASRKPLVTSASEQSEWGHGMGARWQWVVKWMGGDEVESARLRTHFSAFFFFFVIKEGDRKVVWTHPALYIPPSSSFPHTLYI